MRTFHERVTELMEAYQEEAVNYIKPFIPSSFEFMGVEAENMDEGTEHGQFSFEYYNTDIKATFFVIVYGNGTVDLILYDEEEGTDAEQDNVELSHIQGFLEEEIPLMLSERGKTA